MFTHSGMVRSGEGREEQQSGRRGASPAGFTAAAGILRSTRSRSKAFPLPFLQNEIETGLKLMVYKCLEKIFKHFINVKLLLY